MRLRPPNAADGRAIWAMLPEIGTLERNTAYAYLLLATDFADASIVAESDDGRLCGFVVGYRPPPRPEALFVWQVGVAPWARGRGLGSRMLDALVARPASAAVAALEATVEADNRASRALFESFARRHGADVTITPHFLEDHFPAGHAAEPLLRIGPLRTAPQDTKDHP